MIYNNEVVKSIEKEVKGMLTEQQTNKLLNHFNVEGTNFIVNTNYYIDDSNHILKQNGISLRLRCIDQLRYELTLKLPVNEQNINYHTKREITLNLKKDEFDVLLSDNISLNNLIRKLLREENLALMHDDVKVWGFLKTNRYQLSSENDEYNFVLDHSLYNNVEDYEIEFESEYQHFSVLSDLLDLLDIPLELSKYSKSKRFFNSIIL